MEPLDVDATDTVPVALTSVRLPLPSFCPTRPPALTPPVSPSVVTLPLALALLMVPAVRPTRPPM